MENNEENSEGKKEENNSNDSVTIAFVVLLVLAILFGIQYMKKGDFFSLGSGETSQSYSIYTGPGSISPSTILKKCKAYLKKRPAYVDEYYASGYPDGNYGVCTDVIGIALRDSGYDLMEMVYQDEINQPDGYNLTGAPDKCIDFRRVKNLQVYFSHMAISLTTDIYDTASWQGGDIVIWDEHIGMISDRRNERGIPYVLHHRGIDQTNYEEDILETNGTIIGHYRIP